MMNGAYYISAAFLLILLVKAAVFRKVKTRHDRLMCIAILLSILLCLSSAVNERFDGNPDANQVIFTITSVGWGLLDLVFLVFAEYINCLFPDENPVLKKVLPFVRINALLAFLGYIVSIFVPFFFYLENGKYYDGPYLFIEYILVGINYLLISGGMILASKHFKGIYKVEFLTMPLVTMAATLYEYITGVTLQTFVSSLMVFYLYISFNTEHNKSLDLKEISDEKEEIKKESATAISKMYKTMHLADLRTGRYKEIWAIKEVHAFAGNEGNVTDIIYALINKLCMPDYREKMAEFLDLNTLQERLKGGRTLSFDYKNEFDSWYQIVFYPYENDEEGNPVLILFATHSIALAKKKELDAQEKLRAAYEQAEKASAAKTAFLSNMSHDIRTPMNGIVGMTQVAKSHMDDPEKVKDCLEKISMSSEHLLTLINDILELSRIESGKTILARELSDLNEIYAMCISVIRSFIVNRDLKLVETFAPMEQTLVYTDALRMRQILINILSNAVKYTPDGGTITINLDNEPGEDDKHIVAKFTVADTGIGMSEEFLEHVFEPFVQANDRDARTQYKGTGLGMAIVKQSMDLFGGKISIKSKLGEGTTIMLTFPLELGEDRRKIPREKDGIDLNEEISVEGVKVLLVEDNELNIEVATEILSDFGIEVTQAKDGLEAVDKFKASENNGFDCILMDIMMPNMNGYEATVAIRATDRSDSKTIPIIAMSANAFAEDVAKSKEAGMNDHISKPIDGAKVVETIKKHLKMAV